MKKFNFQNRLIYSTIAIVSVIFIVAMAVIYISARNQALDNALQGEQIDLNRNAELLSVMLRSGESVDYVKQIATKPWDDGSGNYVIVDNQTKANLNIAPSDTLLTSTISDDLGEIVIGEIVSKRELIRPMQRMFNYLVGFSILVIIILFVVVRRVIKRLSQPEVDRQYRLDTEFVIARQIQNGMLPNAEESTIPAGIEIGAVITPSKEIGGDFYNYLTVGNHFHFIIADVSGKGIPAALYMAIASKLYSTIAAADLSPKEIAHKLNEALCANNPASMFATALICRLDIITGKVEICNAGHISPLRSRSDEKVAFVDGENNLPLGVVDGYDYKQYETELNPGDHFLLYTDGVTEAEDKQLKQLGQLRFLGAVAVSGNLDAQMLVTEINKYIDNYTKGREQNDDITILDIKRG